MPKTPAVEEVRSALDYDHETGLFLWKSREGYPKSWNTRRAGTAAGSIGNRGYMVIRMNVDGNTQLFLSHRLAWVHFHGEWPDMDIDHINGIPTDNRIQNLRLAEDYQNLRNRGAQSNNQSGYKGVCFELWTGRWRAQLRVKGKNINIGRFDTPEEAYEAYRSAEVAHSEGFHR